jgi:mono/diheme cytochrome c family protein
MKYAIGVILTVALFAWLFSVCSPAGRNRTGAEYMPDMAHSVAYEANVLTDYSYNHWDEESTFRKAQLSGPRFPVRGTVARGYTGVYYSDASALDRVRGKNASNAVAAPINAHAPFPYANTEPERLRAEREIGRNPFPITQEGLTRAKPLYDMFCGICHGDKGDGQGYLISQPDSKYPAQPANLISDVFINAGNGRMYFAIMHGRNVMGPYADKLNFEERWQVIHYIRSLQAKSKNLLYSETANTLNNYDIPARGTASGAARTSIVPLDSAAQQSTPSSPIPPEKTKGLSGKAGGPGK